MKVRIGYDTTADTVELSVEVEQAGGAPAVVASREFAANLVQSSTDDQLLMTTIGDLCTQLGGCAHGHRLVCKAFGDLLGAVDYLSGEASARGAENTAVATDPMARA